MCIAGYIHRQGYDVPDPGIPQRVTAIETARQNATNWR